MKCPYCNGELTQKNRTVLLAAAILLLAGAVASFVLIPLFWIIGLLFLVTAVYLFAWSTRGKGLWCRNCKKFPGR
jgi:hypothetical protein